MSKGLSGGKRIKNKIIYLESTDVLQGDKNLRRGNAENFVSFYWKREDSWFPWILNRTSNLPNLPTTGCRLGLKSGFGKLFPPED